MELGLVTVVVPIYKTEKYLDRCISSIVNQTYQKLEILLIDDGSPDNCPQMCDAWAERDSRICVIHKENEGLGMARNSGIENASGEYICFFDSDDYVALETIDKAYHLAKEQSADIVVFGNDRVNAKGVTVKHNVPSAPKQCYRVNEVQKLFLPDLIDNKHRDAQIRNVCLSACMCLISMDLVRREKWSFVSEREIISEDSYSLIWLYQFVSSVALLPEALYYHCENSSSLTQVHREDRFLQLKRFYEKSRELATQAVYYNEVKVSVSALFLSLLISAMKQIVAANIDSKKKYSELLYILKDQSVQKALSDVAFRVYGKGRRILFFLMRKKCCGWCHLLLVIRIIADGQR